MKLALLVNFSLYFFSLHVFALSEKTQQVSDIRSYESEVKQDKSKQSLMSRLAKFNQF